MGEKMTSEMQTECYRGAYGVFTYIAVLWMAGGLPGGLGGGGDSG